MLHECSEMILIPRASHLLTEANSLPAAARWTQGSGVCLE